MPIYDLNHHADDRRLAKSANPQWRQLTPLGTYARSQILPCLTASICL